MSLIKLMFFNLVEITVAFQVSFYLPLICLDLY